MYENEFIKGVIIPPSAILLFPRKISTGNNINENFEVFVFHIMFFLYDEDHRNEKECNDNPCQPIHF